MNGASFDGRTWGRWEYKHSNLTLLLRNGERVEYEIDLEQSNDSAGVLDWIVQVSETNGISRSDVGNLVEALDELADGLQGKVCPSGINTTFDWNAHLTE